MTTNLTALLFAFGAVVLAEMGDKTQLLAMAFAAKYKFLKVMIGVFLATVLNHALAVALGYNITRIPNAQVWIQAIASLSFIIFGLWTIRGDKLDGEADKKSKFGAIATVAIAFFLAEMGDKTQLATVALAAHFPDSPVWILIGTTLGMLVADAFGIIISVLLCRKIPERIVKFISAGIFIIFGFIGSWQVMKERMDLPDSLIYVILLILLLLTCLTAFFIIRNIKSRDSRNSPPTSFCKLK